MLVVVGNVLLSSDLMAAVTAYQDGIYEDMIPLANVELPRMLGRSKCRVDLKDPALNTGVMKIHNVVSPWLDTFGDSRLAKLFECIQNAKMFLALEAIFHCGTALLEALHNAFDIRSFRGNLVDLAAFTNDLDSVRFLLSHGHRGCTSDAMDAAASHGNVEMVQYLHYHANHGCTTRAIEDATLHGHLHVVCYIRHHGLVDYNPHYHRFLMDHTAANGQLAAVQYLHEIWSSMQ
ncbi:hypothetical protein LEN26_015282 [Aphanomyces euteiches]|nr:hypothetical protein LEN26_015282 [Aphanomyces euteiches]KAH9116211.1 hypothetical protein AeMF1_009848 [Aphanomyces euteiches]KAH9184629.1 hypothetical protein AeNC1_013397 [Aphanomyces euteiches]